MTKVNSKHCVADLMDAPTKFNLQQAGFHFFASHEGKNLSDTIGSHVKAALRRGMLKDEDLEVRTVEQAIAVIQENLKDKSKTFEFFLIQPFPPFDRNPSRKELAIEGIKQLHSMIVVSDKLYAREISCTTCTSSTLCNDCKSSVFATTEYIANPDSETNPNSEECVDEERIQDSDDEGQSDVDTDDVQTDSEDDAQDNVSPGTYVWGKIGRIWYPAIVVAQNDIPSETLQKLGRNVAGKVLVRWVGEGNYSALRENCVELLARNKTDEYRANKSNHISKMYHLALSEIIED